MTAGERIDAVQALRYVVSKLEIVAYVLEKDRPLKEIDRLCKEYNIPIYTSEEINTAILEKSIEQPDVGISYQYRKIIKEPLLSFPRNGIINFHSAPLPEQGGVGCCCYAVLHRHNSWSVTSHYMNEGIDSGAIIKAKSFSLPTNNSTAIVVQRIINKYKHALMNEVVDMLADGKIPEGTPQIGERGYYSQTQLDNEKIILGTETIEEIDHRIRALWLPPYHGAHIMIGEKKYSLVNQEILDELNKLYQVAFDHHQYLFDDFSDA